MNVKVLLGAVRKEMNAALWDWCGLRVSTRKEYVEMRVTSMVSWALDGKDKVVCVQVGAHDGKNGDHLQVLRGDSRWTSYLVEPNPAVLPSLRKNTRTESGSTVLPYAVGTNLGHFDFWVVNVGKMPRSILKRIDFSQISSLSENKVVNEVRQISGLEKLPQGWIEPVTVEVLTWNALFDKHIPEAPDCISIDAEGQDARLILTFPFKRFRPSVIVFEHMWMTEEETDQVQKILHTEKYSLFKINFDTVAILQ